MKKKILSLDDSQDTTRLVAFYLEEEGFAVTRAHDPREVAALLAKEPFDLLICDYMMPEMRGIELIEQLRKDPCCASLPILMLTGKSLSLPDRERCLSAKVVIHAKPFTGRALFNAVCKLLEQSPTAP